MKKFVVLLLFFVNVGLATVAVAGDMSRTTGFFSNPSPGVRALMTGFIDPEGTYGYFVGYYSPSKILRVKLKDEQGITINPVADEVLDVGGFNVNSSLISPSGNYAYAFTNQNQILKINVSNFSLAGTLSGITLKTPVWHPSNRYVYGLNTSPLSVQAIQLDASTETGMSLVSTALSLPNDGSAYSDEISAIDSQGKHAYFMTYKQHNVGSFPSMTTVLDDQTIVVVRVGDEVGNPLSVPERVTSVSIGVNYRVKSIAISPDDSMLYVITSGEVLPFKLKENGEYLEAPQAPAQENIVAISPVDNSGNTVAIPSKITPDGRFLYMANKSSDGNTNVFKIKLKQGSSILAKPEIVHDVNGLGTGENGQVGVLLLDPDGRRMHLGLNINEGPVVTLDTGEFLSTQFTITYDANGGTDAPASIQQDANSSITVASGGSMSRTGFVFSNWNTTADGTGTDYQADAAALFEMDTTLYAQWEALITLAFNSQGGTGANSISGVVGSTVQVASAPTRAGYTFNGWNTSADGSGTSYSSGQDFTMNNSTTVFAQWEPRSYVLSFESNGVVLSTMNATYATAIEAPVPTRSGYTFSAWTPAVPATMNMTQDSTFVAQWVTNNYTLSFDTNGGQSVQSRSYAYQEIIQVPNIPTRTGYTFSGWSPELPEMMGASDITLTAQWEPRSYVLSFESNGVVLSTMNATYATAIEAPVPTRSGYTFSAWTPAVPATMNMTQDSTFVAQWVTNNYTLSFDTNGGQSLQSRSYAYQEIIQVPNIPTRAGYTFSGWSPELPEMMGTSNITLTAQWTANIYTITFDTNGGSAVSSQTLAYNQPFGVLPVSNKMGHRFSGWRIGQNEIVTAGVLMKAENTTLTAIWAEKDYSNISIPTNMDESEEATTQETVVHPSQTFVVPVNAKLMTQIFAGTGVVENNGRIETNELVVGGVFTNHGVLITRDKVQVDSGGSYVSNANSHLIIHHLPSSVESLSQRLAANHINLQNVSPGTFIADGVLTVILDDELPQQAKYPITVVEGAIEGEFDTINLAELPSGYFWDTSELYSSGILYVVGSNSGLVSRPLNYPNPFKWSNGTHIGYHLNGAHDTELRVYTAQGQEVFRRQFRANIDEGAKSGYNKVHITPSVVSDTWPAGVYPYILIQDKNVVGRGRMVVTP